MVKGDDYDATWIITGATGGRNLGRIEGAFIRGAAGIDERCRGAAKKLEGAPRRRYKGAVAQRATQIIQRGMAQAFGAKSIQHFARGGHGASRHEPVE